MRRLRAVGLGVAAVIALAAIWELYKSFGPTRGVIVGGRAILPRTSDRAMPHVWEMVTRLVEPSNGRRGPALIGEVVQASAFSLRIAAVGFVVGVGVGLLLALLMSRLPIAEAAILPWVVLSQTVPLIALAPLVRGWGSAIRFGAYQWQSWQSVAVIAAYLAFFPVSVGMLRGLTSPDRVHLDLMRTYGIGWWPTLVHLRLPASVPFLLSALRLAAAAAVIGTVVAEVSIGLRGGIGRMIIEFAQAAGGDPAKPWAPIFGAVAIGLVAAGCVALLGLALRRYRRSEVAA